MGWWTSGSYVSPSSHWMLSQSYPISAFSYNYHISLSSSNICIICLTYLETQFTSQVWVLHAYIWALTWVTEPSMFWQQSAFLTSSCCSILISIKDNIFLYDLFHVWGVTCSLLKKKKDEQQMIWTSHGFIDNAFQKIIKFRHVRVPHTTWTQVNMNV